MPARVAEEGDAAREVRVLKAHRMNGRAFDKFFTFHAQVFYEMAV